MQLYWVPWLEYPRGQADLPRPGQFVFKNNDSDTLSGFIAGVDYNCERSLFCLFEPDDLDLPEAEVLSAAISDAEVMERLHLALEANPALKPQWIEAVQS